MKAFSPCCRVRQGPFPGADRESEMRGQHEAKGLDVGTRALKAEAK